MSKIYAVQGDRLPLVTLTIADPDDNLVSIAGCTGANAHMRKLGETAGKTDLVDKCFKGSTYTAAWYLGLKGTGSAAAGDTLAAHGGWAEVTPYSGNRPAITFGTTSDGSNTATTVSYSITGSATVAGAFIANAS